MVKVVGRKTVCSLQFLMTTKEGQDGGGARCGEEVAGGFRRSQRKEGCGH